MAELSDAEKHAISHRGKAARELLDWLDSDGRGRVSGAG
jgi:inosine/xanthosine triphosphate pyrophosphatase family protein